jgi:hypothetical protein
VPRKRNCFGFSPLAPDPKSRVSPIEDVGAGYVREEKRFEGRRPQSRYRLTRTGRTALLRHVAELQALAAPEA